MELGWESPALYSPMIQRLITISVIGTTYRVMGLKMPKKKIVKKPNPNVTKVMVNQKVSANTPNGN
jgi:hypothetical protein